MKRGELSRRVRHTLAIDCASDRIVIDLVGKGVVVDEAHCCAVDTASGEIVAIGDVAAKMEGRVGDSIEIVYPAQTGAVADYERFEQILSRLLADIHVKERAVIQRPDVFVAVPATLSEIEQRALVDLFQRVGTRSVVTVERGVSAAVSIRKDVVERGLFFVVEIGDSSSEVAVMSDGTIVARGFIDHGHSDVHESVSSMLVRKHAVVAGSGVVQDLTRVLGSVVPMQPTRHRSITGLTVKSSQVKTISIASDELTVPLRKALRPVIEMVRGVIATLPDDLIGALHQQGVYICGGGARIAGMDTFLSETFSVPCTRAPKPGYAVVKGLKRMASLHVTRGSELNSLLRTSEGNNV